jgi:hypothetical protein
VLTFEIHIASRKVQCAMQKCIAHCTFLFATSTIKDKAYMDLEIDTPNFWRIIPKKRCLTPVQRVVNKEIDIFCVSVEKFLSVYSSYTSALLYVNSKK